MTIIDLDDTVRFHRPFVGEQTRHLGIQDLPSVPLRRPAADPVTAERAAFGLAATSTGEQPLIFQFPAYAGRHRAKLSPVITPVTPGPAQTRPGLVRRLIARLGRIGG